MSVSRGFQRWQILKFRGGPLLTNVGVRPYVFGIRDRGILTPAPVKLQNRHAPPVPPDAHAWRFFDSSHTAPRQSKFSQPSLGLVGVKFFIGPHAEWSV